MNQDTKDTLETVSTNNHDEKLLEKDKKIENDNIEKSDQQNEEIKPASIEEPKQKLKGKKAKDARKAAKQAAEVSSNQSDDTPVIITILT